jgi:hypothetical protein
MRGPDAFGPGQGPTTGSRKHGNETWASQKGGISQLAEQLPAP